MELHRSAKQADWDQVRPEKRNRWQQLAVRTHGAVTPANIVTLIGAAISVYGLVLIVSADYWTAVVALFVGRVLDIVDGLVAHRTGTKSPLGELLDAGIDKILTLSTLIVFGWYDIMHWTLIGLLVLPHAVIALLSVVSALNGKKLHPSKSGKLSMAFAWFAIGGFAIAAALLSQPLLIAVSLLSVGVSIVYGVVAIAGYSKKAKL